MLRPFSFVWIYSTRQSLHISKGGIHVSRTNIFRLNLNSLVKAYVQRSLVSDSYIKFQTSTHLSDLVEDYATASGRVEYISALDRLSEWLKGSEAKALMPPYDHVMLSSR